MKCQRKIETRFIAQHESCECKCSLRVKIISKKQKWNHNEWYYICFSHNYAKIKIDSYNFFPLEKTLTLLNVKIFSF